MDLIRKLQNMRCPRHNQHPAVSISGGRLVINSCCCDDFRKKLASIAGKEVRQDEEQKFEKDFKRIFKR
jgi:hypothetical protein